MTFQDIELQILSFFNHPSATSLNMMVVTAIFAVYAFLIYLVYHYFRANYTTKFAHIVISEIVGYLFVTVVKYLVARPRPYIDEAVNAVITKPYDPYSFPSGHSFIAFLLLNFLPPNWPKFVKYLAIVYIIFVPLGSMYIGIHYPSDVLVGSLLGFIFPKLLSENISFKIFKSVFTSAFSAKR